ncbi:hypothetical protein [Janthinobacterium sp. PC23-8]|uniref:hypothetical protein n=1 Tax=Janthinobacterium sp. PC23-8 TaxID=2012679 RepID=UPI000B967F76|nr:hypothetical protein [Janthinobacterium sp. PC23-8]
MDNIAEKILRADKRDTTKTKIEQQKSVQKLIIKKFAPKKNVASKALPEGFNPQHHITLMHERETSGRSIAATTDKQYQKLRAKFA